LVPPDREKLGPPRFTPGEAEIEPALAWFSIRQLNSIFPFAVESAPYFSALVASSLKINPTEPHIPPED